MTANTLERDLDVEAVERAALRRRAQERLDRIDDMRAAYSLHLAKKTQREIADILHTTQPRVHRMLKAMELRGNIEETPEEVILRATVEGTDRKALLERLSRMSYTFTEYAPEPFDGSKPGTWTQVKVACATGLLTREEFDEIATAVKAPA